MGKAAYAVALIALGLALVYNYSFMYDFVYVEIDKGVLRGLKTTTWRGVPYFSFRGIPYAKPPVGELRFKAPQEETPWDGVRDSLFYGSICPQMDPLDGIYRGEEDCLSLNVFTSSLKAYRKAVMVWIHGGSFFLRSGDRELYGPDYFMETDVVLVTMNYRLGALGFLSTEDEGAPGNAGLKDQVAALRWVRRNIAKFGGDPDNVTIFGASSGATCVHLHLLSPMSAGLFVRAIVQSGSSLNAWLPIENGSGLAVRLAESLGAKDINGDMAEVLKFLKATPVQDIVRMQKAILTPEEKQSRVPIIYLPVVEKNLESEEIFLPDWPLKILESGNFNTVPFMTGYTNQEAHLPAILDPEMVKMAFDSTDRIFPQDIKNEEFRLNLAKSVCTFYFNDKPITADNMQNYINLFSDITVITNVIRSTKLMLQSSNATVYFYVFSHDGGKNIFKPQTNDLNITGASHGDDIGYLFHQNLYYWKTPAVGSDDGYVIHTMIRLWTNFAKYGDPTPAGDPLSWKPMTLDEFNYLNISGRDIKMGVNPDFERENFWGKAYEEYESLKP